MYQWFLTSKPNFFVGSFGIVFGFPETQSISCGINYSDDIPF